MSTATTFSKAKGALRRGAFALAAAVPFFAANAAHASDFSQRQCGIILSASSEVMDALARAERDPVLVQSLAEFIAPSNPGPVRFIIENASFAKLARSKAPKDMEAKRALIPTLTCDGNKEIRVSSNDGGAIFLTIDDYLQVQPEMVDIHKAGLYPVLISASTPISSLEQPIPGG